MRLFAGEKVDRDNGTEEIKAEVNMLEVEGVRQISLTFDLLLSNDDGSIEYTPQNTNWFLYVV